MDLPAPGRVWVGSCFALVRRSCKGFFLCDGEAAGFGLPCVLRVQVAVRLLESGGVKAAALDDRVSDLENVDVHFVRAVVDHVGFQIVLDGFGFGLRRFNEGLQLFQLSDLRGEFVC